MLQYKADCVRVTHPYATRQQVLLPLLPFDLHVLGLPLAFILSQDQTLHCKRVRSLFVDVYLPLPKLGQIKIKKRKIINMISYVTCSGFSELLRSFVPPYGGTRLCFYQYFKELCPICYLAIVLSSRLNGAILSLFRV